MLGSNQRVDNRLGHRFSKRVFVKEQRLESASEAVVVGFLGKLEAITIGNKTVDDSVGTQRGSWGKTREIVYEKTLLALEDIFHVF